MHDHATQSATDQERMRLAFLVALVVLAAEAAGGFLANSLALLADAGHMLTDVVALGLSWFASHQAGRPADAAKTFGYHRTGILVALFNAATLLLIALVIVYQAYQRLFQPQEVWGLAMSAVALLALGANLYIGKVLAAGSRENLNVRSALLHVMGDAAASAGVVLAGLVVWWTRWYAIDPLLSSLIALFIGFGAWQIVGDTVNILMEAAPRGLDLVEVALEIRRIEGVKDVHDLHVWSIASGMHTLSCHVDIDDQQVGNTILVIFNICQMLRQRFAIHHTTIQPECDSCDPNSLYCVLPQTSTVRGP